MWLPLPAVSVWLGKECHVMLNPFGRSEGWKNVSVACFNPPRESHGRTRAERREKNNQRASWLLLLQPDLIQNWKEFFHKRPTHGTNPQGCVCVWSPCAPLLPYSVCSCSLSSSTGVSMSNHANGMCRFSDVSGLHVSWCFSGQDDGDHGGDHSCFWGERGVSFRLHTAWCFIVWCIQTKV